jgi:hypothetical protein
MTGNKDDNDASDSDNNDNMMATAQIITKLMII